MSWGALPYWIYAVDEELREAAILGGFDSEIYSGSTRSLPKENYKTHKSTFSSYDGTNWNSWLNDYVPDRFDSLIFEENFL